jgi:hypothetical protein
MNGKIVLNPTSTQNAIDIHSLSKGSYILILKDANNKTFQRKIVKK